MLLRRVDLVVTLRREAVVEVSAGTELRNWDTDEPSERGIGGVERMRRIRDDISTRVDALLAELVPTAVNWSAQPTRSSSWPGSWPEP